MPLFYDRSGRAHPKPLNARERLEGPSDDASKQTNAQPKKPASLLGSPAPPVYRRRIFPVRTDIAVITAFFNPCGFTALRRNYDRFAQELRSQGVPLYTCEATYKGRDPEITYGNVRHVNTDAAIFLKENLLNLAVEIVPLEFTKIAFIDCDFLFSAPDWAWEASEILDRIPAVQCWRYMVDLDERGRPGRKTHSIGFRDDGKGRPGGGWAVHREIFSHFGGLYDRMVTGGGDMVHTYGAFLGRLDTYFFKQYNAEFARSMRRWCEPVFRYVRGDIASITADCAHLFHGTRANRRYGYRSKVVIGLDPDEQLGYNEDGALDWRDAPEEIVEGMRKSLEDRKEDVGEDGNPIEVRPDLVVWNGT